MLLLCCFSIGIFLGAQITEAILFVPNWKRIKTKDFNLFYKTYGNNIHAFYSPLTIIATTIPIATVTYSTYLQQEHSALMILMGISTLSYFSTYFLYFKKANKSFSLGNLKDHELQKELVRWEAWHWTRITFEAIAFICALLLLKN